MSTRRTSRRRPASSRRPRPSLRLEMLERRDLFYGVNFANSEPSPSVMAQNVDATLEDSVVGYGLSISMGDTTLPENNTFTVGSGGDARIPADGYLPFTPITRLEQASVSKPITGAALVKLVQDEILAGNMPDGFPLPSDGSMPIKNLVDTALDYLKLVDYLPADWLDNIPEGVADEVNSITFRDLLKHESGLTEYVLSSEGLRQMLQGLAPDELEDEDFYTTTNYSFLRTVIPRLWTAVDNGVLDGTSSFASLPADMQESIEEDWGDSPLWWNIVNDTPHPIYDVSDYLHASLFKYYIRTNLLEPAGTQNADMKDESDSPALVYAFPEASSGLNTDDQTLFAGGRGWRLSAVEVQSFMTHLRFNDAIILPEVRELLWEETDLIFQPYSLGQYGTFLRHNGANHAPSGCSEPKFGEWEEGDDLPDSNCHRVNTIAGIFDQHDVAVSLVMNSQVAGEAYLGDFPNGNWKADILAEAYKDSFVGFAIDGNGDDNVFELRRQSGGSSVMEVVLDGEVVLQRSIERLEWLTFNGLGGEDQFLISELPESIRLNMNGGGGEDDFLLGVLEDDAIQGQNFSEYIFGPITIDGGGADDFVHVQDSATTGSAYTLTENTFAGPTYDTLFQYSGVETFRIDANSDGNDIQILNTPDNITVSVYAGLGSDEITVSNTGGSATLNLFPGSDTDTTTVLGSADGSTIVIENQLVGVGDGADTLFLGAGNVGSIDGAIEYLGGTQDDLIVVRDADAVVPKEYDFKVIAGDRQELELLTNGVQVFDGLTYEKTRFLRVEGGKANDRFDIYSVYRGTDITAWGGKGNDTFNVTHLNRSFNPVEGKVFLDGEFARTDRRFKPEGNDQMYLYDTSTKSFEQYIVEPHLAPYNRVVRDRFWLAYAGMEDSTLNTSNADSVIDIRGIAPLSGTLNVNANLGSDTVRISPTAENQDTLRSLVNISGGTPEKGTIDYLHVHDRFSANTKPYLLTETRISRPNSAVVEYKNFDQVTWELNDVGNRVNVLSTPSDTFVYLRGGQGDDDLLARGLNAEVLFDAGDGSDTAEYRGSLVGDEFDVTEDEIRLKQGVLRTAYTELRRVNGWRGLDRMTLHGTAGISETIHVMPGTGLAAGTIEVDGWWPLNFVSTEEHVVRGNAGDGDLLHIDGAAGPAGDDVVDIFQINLGGGAGKGPIASLRAANGRERLRLVDYTDISAAVFDGQGGNDQFIVSVGAGPGRTVGLLGGSGSDELNVQYEESADFVWESYGQSGSMGFDLDDELFGISYQGMESVPDPLPV